MESKKTRSIVAFLLLCLINLCVGSLYSWSVFAGPMGEYLNSVTEGGLSAGAMSLVFTVATAVGPVTMILGGKINDRFGAKWILFASGIMFGGGMILSGLAKDLGLLIVGYGVLGGLGGAMHIQLLSVQQLSISRKSAVWWEELQRPAMGSVL